MTLKDLLAELLACKEAKEWVGDKNIEQALKQSERGDWLLWLAQKLDLPLNKLTLAKARCAKTVIHLMKDQRIINAVNVAERFGLDECTLEELNAAAAAAYAASTSAYAAYAPSAAAASTSAYAAAYAASTSAYAAAYAAYAAAAASTSKTKNRQQTSDICIEILGELIIDAVNKKIKPNQTT